MKIIFFMLCVLTGFITRAQDFNDKFLTQKDSIKVSNEVEQKLAADPDPGMITDSFAHHFRQELSLYSFNQNRRVFQWQYISSIIIFFVVMLIVFTGLYLSYLQFKRAAVSNTKLEIGSAGIKIDTAVIGLAILTLSLSFLFLYLKYVYPITLVKIQ